MNKKFKEIGIKAVSIALSAALFVSSTVHVTAAGNIITEYDFDQFKYVLFSDETDLLLNENIATIQGDVYTGGDLKFTGNEEKLTVIGNLLKGSNGQNCEIDNYVDVINSNAAYNFTYDESKKISSMNIDLSNASIYGSKDLTLDDVNINGKGNITVKDDITIDLRSDKATNQEAIVMSENGDITINCAEFTFNGLIYAPNGKVKINSKEVSYVGAIYADEIEINGTKLSMEYKDFLPDQLVCDAGEDKVTYLEDSVQLSASCNYNDAEISYSVSDEQSELVNFTDGNTLTPTLKFTKVGEYAVTMTAKLNNTTVTDTVKVTVTPEPVVTYTTTEDFASGELSSVANDNDELKLSSDSSESTPYKVTYNTEADKGVSVTSEQSKTAVNSNSDTLDINYTLKGYGKAEYSKGNDMVLLVDNSGSMSSKLNVLKDSALKILDYMGPNDRFGLSDLGQVKLNLTNDKDALTTEINKCNSGSGSSDYVAGVEKYAMSMFNTDDNEHDKYIVLLSDGELVYTESVIPNSQTYKGHYYSVINESMPWSDAKKYCESLGGHLVTIQDEAEQNFITNLISNNPQKNTYWIGLKGNNNSYSWITDEPFDYANWAPNEPNNFEETVVHMCAAVEDREPGQWNDTFNEYVHPFVGYDKCGIICEWEEDPYIYTKSIERIAKQAEKQGIKVIVYQLNDAPKVFNENTYDGYAMQELADVTKGYYQISLDANEISESILQFAGEVYNSAGNDVTLTTTVVNKAYLDTASAENAPSSIIYNDDGSATVSWTYSSIDIDTTKEIKLPLKPELITGESYQVIAKDTKLTYYDRSGNGTIVKLEDVIVGKNDYVSNGKWTSNVYDSGKDGCTWSLVNWNAEYNGTSSIDVYLSVSDDGENFSESVKVSNNQSLQGLNGRYIKTEVKMNVSADGNTPVLYDLTIYSDDNQQPDNSSLPDQISICSSGSKKANSPVAMWLDTKGYNDNIKNVEWSITDSEGNVTEDNIVIKSQNDLLKYITFTKVGSYIVNVSVKTVGGVERKASLKLTIEKQDTISKSEGDSNIIPDLEMTVTGIPEVIKYGDAINLNISYNHPEQVAWSRVYYYPESKYVEGGLRRAAYIDVTNGNAASFTCNYAYANDNCVIVVRAFDQYGNYVEYKKDVFVDSTRPSVTMQVSNYSPYCGQDVTVTTIASDNYAVESVALMLDDNVVELDENGKYTFTKEEEGSHILKAIVTDKAGLTYELQRTITFRTDTSKPYCNFNCPSSIVLGNSMDVVLTAYDNQTGLKSYKVTLNGEEITMTPGENNNYNYTFKPEAVGDYVFEATVVDKHGNQTVVTRNVKCTADVNRPSVNIALSNNEIVAGENVTVKVTATDNVKVTDLRFYVNDVEQTLLEDNTFVYTSDDTNLNANGYKNVTFKAIAKDDAGNEATATKVLKVIQKDNTPPTINISCNSKLQILSKQYMTVTVNDNIAVKDYKVYVNGEEVTLDENNRFYFDTSDFRQYNIKVVATDTAGNVSEKTFTTNVVDTSRPSISVTKNKSTYAMGDTAEFTVKITDNYKLDTTTVNASFDGQEVDASGDSFIVTVENLTAGVHKFVVTCADTSGNVATSTTTINVKDTEAPTVSITTDKEKYAFNETPLFDYVISDNLEIKTVEAYLNDTALEYADGVLNLPSSFEPGEYIISIKATDTSGNTSEASCKFTVLKSSDVTCPIINSITYSPEQWQIGTLAYIKVNATDDSGKVTVTITANDTPLNYDSMNEQFEFTPSSAGDVTFKIKAEDESGNYVTAEFVKYVYDSLEGHKLLVTADRVVKVGSETTVTLSSSDNYPFKTTSLRCDTTGKDIACDEAESNVYKFTLDTAGEYTFTATGVDEQGVTDTKVFTITAASSYEADVNSEAMKQYLTQTTETMLTEEMQNIKNSFNSPVDAYAYVVNNIKYESYINSRRGAVGAYETCHGNDYDQASLLIGFMREMGYPARYASGSITLTEDQLKSLFGASDFTAACEMISNSGRKCVLNRTNNILTMDQVWVEVYVPYSMIGETDEAKKDLGVWVQLDTSIKPSELIVKEISQDIAHKQLHTQDVLNAYSGTEMSSIIDSISSKDVADSVSDRVIKQQTFTTLPSKLQYTVKSQGNTFAAITNNMSDTITLYMEDYFDSYTLGTYKSVDLYGKRITVQYIGNTGNGTIFELGSSAVAGNVFKPALTIDGEIVSYGPETTLGNEQQLQFTVKSGGNTTSFTDELVAGSMYSVILDTGYISEQTYNRMFNTATEENPMAINDKTPTAKTYYDEAKVGTYLAYAGNAYFMYCDAQNAIKAAMNNVERGNQLKVAVTGYEINTELNFMNQHTKVLPGRFFIDVDMNSVYASSRSGDKEARNDYMFSTGTIESLYEGFIWEMLLGHKSVSTMSVLFKAAEEGYNMIPINAKNYNEQINNILVSSSVKNEIRNAVNQGNMVLIPDKEVTIGSWKGTGYIIGDFENYNHFVFKISGGINGGSSSDTDDLDDVINNFVTYEFFESIGADYDDFFCNTFAICHSLYYILLAMEVSQYTSIGNLYLRIGQEAINELTDLDIFEGASTLITISGYYADLLDSILTYADESIEGVQQITSLFFHMMCDLVGAEADDLGRAIKVMYGTVTGNEELVGEGFDSAWEAVMKNILTLAITS